jgi:hypothetical protein
VKPDGGASGMPWRPSWELRGGAERATGVDPGQ